MDMAFADMLRCAPRDATLVRMESIGDSFFLEFQGLCPFSEVFGTLSGGR
jgi:hypothetical protein